MKLVWKLGLFLLLWEKVSKVTGISPNLLPLTYPVGSSSELFRHFFLDWSHCVTNEETSAEINLEKNISLCLLRQSSSNIASHIKSSPCWFAKLSNNVPCLGNLHFAIFICDTILQHYTQDLVHVTLCFSWHFSINTLITTQQKNMFV